MQGDFASPQGRMFQPVEPNACALKSITSVPTRFQGIFHTIFSPIFSHFNAMQTQVP